MTLGTKISAAAVLDRDYRTDAECAAITKACEEFCDCVAIHRRKEIENFLLVPQAIDRAAKLRIADRAKRTASEVEYLPCAATTLHTFAGERKNSVMAQYVAAGRQFMRSVDPKQHEVEVAEAELATFGDRWENEDTRFNMIPGKEAVSAVNVRLQAEYQISITPTAIIDAMHQVEIPAEMIDLIASIETFATTRSPE